MFLFKIVRFFLDNLCTHQFDCNVHINATDLGVKTVFLFYNRVIINKHIKVGIFLYSPRIYATTHATYKGYIYFRTPVTTNTLDLFFFYQGLTLYNLGNVGRYEKVKKKNYAQVTKNNNPLLTCRTG